MIRAPRAVRPRSVLGASAAALSALALAACSGGAGSAETSAAGSPSAQQSTTAVPEATASPTGSTGVEHSSTSSGAASSSAPGSQSTAAASEDENQGSSDTGDSAGGLPMLLLGHVVEKHAAVEWAGEDEGPITVPQRAVVDTVTKLTDASDVDCSGKAVTGKPAVCTVTSPGDGQDDTRTFSVYPVRAGQGNPGLLFVEGKSSLPSSVAKRITRDDVIVVGLQSGTGYGSRDHSRKETEADVKRVAASSNAMLAWENEELRRVSCTSGMKANTFEPTRCTFDVTGLDATADILPARYYGVGAEDGALVLYTVEV